MTAADVREVTAAPTVETCALCGADRTTVALALSSKSGFKRYVCASPSGCRRRREQNDALAATEARGVERGRTEAAEAIAAHRDKFWPKDDRLDPARARVRRHLNIAIQVAGPPITLEDAAKALRAHLEAVEGDDRA